MSFNPLYEQIDCECAGAPVRTPEPENGTSGVPGRPVTSPAKAALELPPTRATVNSAAATSDFVCSIFFSPPRRWCHLLAPHGELCACHLSPGNHHSEPP